MTLIDLTKSKLYIIESINDPFIIEFTDYQTVYDEEEYPGLKAYECYMLDDENEPYARAIYYYDIRTESIQYLLFHQDNKITKIKIYCILPIQGGETIEEVIDKADESNGLTMGDNC